MSRHFNFNAQQRAPSAPAESRPISNRGEDQPLAFQGSGAISIVQREGLIGWWLNLTAPPWPAQPISITERELLRKAELTSFSILAIFAFLIALLSNSLADLTTAQAVGLMAFFLLLAAILNRTGHTRAAAYLIPSAMLLILMAAVIQAPGGLKLIGLPVYDLCVVPVILVSLTGDRKAPWLFAAISIAFVVVTFSLERHEVIVLSHGVTFDGVGYEESIFGLWGMINRHVALLFFAALFGWLGSRSVDNAIARADRAEEIARLQLIILEQKRQLEQGIQAIQQTQVRVANGDYLARAPLPEDHILWQVAYSLNTMIQRLERAAGAEQMFQRTKGDVERLVQEIRRARSGERPNWPPASGSLLDPLIKEVAGPAAF
jgi:hypothetical protein